MHSHGTAGWNRRNQGETEKPEQLSPEEEELQLQKAVAGGGLHAPEEPRALCHLRIQRAGRHRVLRRHVGIDKSCPSHQVRLPAGSGSGSGSGSSGSNSNDYYQLRSCVVLPPVRRPNY